MPMPVALNSGDRLALAPINMNVASPGHNRKASPTLRNRSFPLTPSNTPRPFLPKSASVLVKSDSVDPRGPLAGYKITNNRNVKADLAATKLKLRLQLAFYKLKQQKDASTALTPHIRSASRISLWKSFTSVSNKEVQPKNNESLLSKESLFSKLGRFPLLNTVASQKKVTMHLLHIKNLSCFYDTFPPNLPLRNRGYKLPSVHKILKTPIKAAARGRPVVGDSNSDETIDETADETMVESSRRNDDILSSSPIRHNSFGTPNSFSVAKSLLLLGLARF